MDPGETEWRDRLRAGGYRVTPQRQLVLEAVAALEHATPESILAQVQLTSTAVNLSTVYRSLEVLEEVGLVTHAHLGHGSPAYHSADEAPHIHLVCSGCGRVLSVPAEVAEPFASVLESSTGFRADIAHVTVQGLCHACRRSAA
jgi:Fur family transcriptional regulator, ferric uptake regulator